MLIQRLQSSTLHNTNLLRWVKDDSSERKAGRGIRKNAIFTPTVIPFIVQSGAEWLQTKRENWCYAVCRGTLTSFLGLPLRFPPAAGAAAAAAAAFSEKGKREYVVNRAPPRGPQSCCQLVGLQKKNRLGNTQNVLFWYLNALKKGTEGLIKPLLSTSPIRQRVSDCWLQWSGSLCETNSRAPTPSGSSQEIRVH